MIEVLQFFTVEEHYIGGLAALMVLGYLVEEIVRAARRG